MIPSIFSLLFGDMLQLVCGDGGGGGGVQETGWCVNREGWEGGWWRC